MKTKNEIDFEKIDWSAVGGKIDFFYDEAIAYNNKIIEDINALNSKGFSMLAGSLAVLCAAVAGLFAVQGKADMAAAQTALYVACGSLFVVTFLSLLSVTVMEIIRGEGSPFNYFSTGIYKQNLPSIKATKLEALHRYIRHNQRVMRRRGLFVKAAVFAAASAPVLTVIVFFAAVLCS